MNDLTKNTEWLEGLTDHLNRQRAKYATQVMYCKAIDVLACYMSPACQGYWEGISSRQIFDIAFKSGYDHDNVRKLAPYTLSDRVMKPPLTIASKSVDNTPEKNHEETVERAVEIPEETPEKAIPIKKPAKPTQSIAREKVSNLEIKKKRPYKTRVKISANKYQAIEKTGPQPMEEEYHVPGGITSAPELEMMHRFIKSRQIIDYFPEPTKTKMVKVLILDLITELQDSL